MSSLLPEMPPLARAYGRMADGSASLDDHICPVDVTERSYYALLTLITVFAWAISLALTVKFVGLSAPLDRADGLDEIDYEQFAYELSVGRGFVLPDGTPTARRAPGTSLLLAPIFVLFGRSLVAARLWMTLLSAMICPAAAWVIRPYLKDRAALLTALLCAVNPGLFYYALHLWSEVPYVLALLLGTGCLLRSLEQNSRRWSVCAGCCWGAALLIRPQLIFVAPCIAAVLPFLPRPARRRWLTELVWQGALVGAILAPWLIRNQVVIGAPTMTTLVSGHTFWGAHNEVTFHDPRFRGSWRQHLQDPTMTLPNGTELEQDRQAWDNGWRCVRRNWQHIPQLLLWKVYRLITPFEETTNRAVYWAFAASWLATAPLAAMGLLRLRRSARPLFVWILMHLASLLICTLLFYGAARFRHSFEPFFMMAVAAAVLRTRHESAR